MTTDIHPMRPWYVRLRHSAGFCWCCWRRGPYTAEIVPLDASGNPLGSATYRLCAQHVEKWMSGALSVAHEVEATFDTGSAAPIDT